MNNFLYVSPKILHRIVLPPSNESNFNFHHFMTMTDQELKDLVASLAINHQKMAEEAVLARK